MSTGSTGLPKAKAPLEKGRRLLAPLVVPSGIIKNKGNLRRETVFDQSHTMLIMQGCHAQRAKHKTQLTKWTERTHRSHQCCNEAKPQHCNTACQPSYQFTTDERLQ